MFEAAATVMRYFAMTSGFQVRILLLSKEVGYLLSLNEFGEESQATITLGKIVSKPYFS